MPTFSATVHRLLPNWRQKPKEDDREWKKQVENME